MSKRIAFCADGTWDGTANNTNVLKLFNILLNTPQQIALYDTGVGADGNPIERLLGGAFGTGLFQKIKDGYTKISNVYDEGDEIFLFGFSRGAYTARSLAGMIAICGLPTKPFDGNFIEAAFQAYRNKTQRDATLASLSQYGLYDAKITMVGVWDTVGSLGIPAIVGGVNPVVYGFLDTGLHPDVLNACHALAIDERRSEFPPTLWTSTPAPNQTIKQVWFCGVHSDVGGGYATENSDDGTTLSDITLGWMIKNATDLGLEVAPAAVAQCVTALSPKYALDQLHESWNPLWGFPKQRTIEANSCLADSVVVRCQNVAYQPINLVVTGGSPAEAYQVIKIVT
jgi:uncharacterized protein (DUF2235 family)